MRVLFCSRPAYGHLYPMMPLALAARDAGHDVVFATTGRFVTMLRDIGFPAVRVGVTLTQAPAQGGRPDLELAARLFIDVLGSRTATDLAPRLNDLAPDVVVYEQADFGAAVAAGAAGIRALCHAISPRMPVEAIESAAREPVARLWASQGVELAPFDVFTGESYLDIVPPSLQHPPFLDHPARRPLRPIPWSELGAGRRAWVGGGRRPLVYLTLGTVVGRADNLMPAIQALGRLDADVLLALGSAAGDRLEGIPDNVRVEAFVDQAAVLPHADLVVHHGGTGTVLGALAHGRRQLVLPKGADQFLNADALRASGIADVLEPEEATADAIETAARAAIDAPVAPAVLAARDEIAAMPSPAEALAELLDQVPA